VETASSPFPCGDARILAVFEAFGAGVFTLRPELEQFFERGESVACGRGRILTEGART
jgi:hypothetical protein